MQCEYIDDCVFFNDHMDGVSATISLFKRMYCNGNCLNCARHMVAKRMGCNKIPPTLYPDNRREAFRMISDLSGTTDKPHS